jgi:hypothetical protein
MDEISKPKYQPGQWLRYKYGNGQGISKIVGASYFPRKGWMYSLINPMDQSTSLMINENDIIELVDSA